MAAARLIKSGARIQVLLDDLVDFSRTQMGVGINVVRAPVDLAEIFNEQVNLQRAAHPGRSLTLEITGDVAGAWDGNRIHQVLGNLVSNALQYGDASAPVEVKLIGDAACVTFKVVNRGAAIPETFIHSIFEPLWRGPQAQDNADPGSNSLGLGLYIAREIVRAHQGDIAVHSDETGTVFAIELPR